MPPSPSKPAHLDDGVLRCVTASPTAKTLTDCSDSSSMHGAASVISASQRRSGDSFVLSRLDTPPISKAAVGGGAERAAEMAGTVYAGVKAKMGVMKAEVQVSVGACRSFAPLNHAYCFDLLNAPSPREANSASSSRLTWRLSLWQSLRVGIAQLQAELRLAEESASQALSDASQAAEVKLAQGKQQAEASIARHLSFIDRLLADKQARLCNRS